MSGTLGCVRRPLWSASALLLLLVAAFAGRLEAQKVRALSVSGSQSLAFGAIFPGVITVVPRTDALRTGQLQVTGTRNTQIQVTFTLPAGLASGSESVPLQFAAGDGGVSTDRAIASATAFDPRVPLTATLSAQGKLYLFLGGTALPASQQVAGDYSATLTATVCYVGLTC